MRLFWTEETCKHQTQLSLESWGEEWPGEELCLDPSSPGMCPGGHSHNAGGKVASHSGTGYSAFTHRSILAGTVLLRPFVL